MARDEEIYGKICRKIPHVSIGEGREPKASLNTSIAGDPRVEIGIDNDKFCGKTT